ncbi:YugN-like family protein [Paenibacillus profundus]|uniref:YugN-like family protein n=1 Tax=Paenibacillus profundus TaxID=1173085 RepID=A0ABS8YJG6_9BACL|nr:YugN family protein [Paenibacillus profundus]MCE5172038.1 YugN-like family protein [Paenibacillus profundus]
MQLLQGKMTGRKYDTNELVRELGPLGFSIGGNWDYAGGSFDCALNDEQTVWLRLPFHAVNGTFDADSAETVLVQLERPYVLKHQYQTGNDPSADAQLFGSLVNQFQSPTDKDASLQEEELKLARAKLDEAEDKLDTNK